MPVLGIDIGTTSTKVVQLSDDSQSPRILTAGVAVTPLPGMKSESVSDLNKMAISLKKLVNDSRVTRSQVVCALPEAGVHVEVVTMPPMSEGELASAIVWEAEQFIPFQISEAELSWQVVGKPDPNKKGQMQVLVAATPKRMVEKYLAVLTEAGLNVVAMEPESLTLSRSVGRFTDVAGSVVDIGASGTTIMVAQHGATILSRRIPTGGDALTRSLAATLNLDPVQAEQYKRTYGLGENQLEGKVRKALTPVIEVIINEIRKVMEYYQSKNPNQKISTVILTGGGSGLPELDRYFIGALNLEVVIGDPFAGIGKDQRFTASLTGYEPLYGVAVGCALRRTE
jgi:type IV pilus assembly protein PilM